LSQRKVHIEALGKLLGTKSSSAQISFNPDLPRFSNLLTRKQGKTSFWNNRRIWFLIWVQVFAFVELYSYLLPLVFGGYWDEAVHFHLKLTISTFLSTLSIDLVSMGHVMRLARRVGFIN
jgi:hypothetical protein